MIIKDSMIVIHLAKLSILEKSCIHFKETVIPELVYEEIMKGKEKNFPEIPIITKLIKEKKIKIKKVKEKNLIEKANQFNIQRGEAETIALYWQEKADLIATDDDNVRKKRTLLNINIIGTPAIIVKLYRKNLIDKNKAEQCTSELRKMGWFSNSVIDQIKLEVQK